MTREQELARNVYDYVKALAYSHHVDERELFAAVSRMASAETTRIEGLDPARNR